MLTPGDQLGFVEVNGDNLTKADAVVVTALKAPGPGEKGHIAVQTADEYRVPMLVPAGAYDVWVVPANGVRARRIAANVRVYSRCTTQVSE